MTFTLSSFLKYWIKIACFLLIQILPCFLRAQNLVPNWSFEDTLFCPIGIGGITQAEGWRAFRQSPDYFNSCNGGLVSTPQNLDGFQYPRTGNAYAGLVTFALGSPYAREYLGIHLLEELVVGNRYRASCFVSRSFTYQYFNNIATNKIGFRFSTVPFSYNDPTPIDNIAHIFSDSIIEDTLNWVEISGSFLADSAYQYLIIGNFFADSLTSRIRFDSSASVAFYYIDDVTLTLDTVSGVINQNVLNETISIFPNPASNWFKLTGKNIRHITIIDLLGRNRKEFDVKNTTTVSIPIYDLESGIYLIEIQTLQGKIIRKLMIE